MSNTVIQIKRSTATAIPANGSLAAAEQAYSFLSDKLFIGNTAGTGVIEIGGKYWVDTTVAAFGKANDAYALGETAYGQGNVAFNQANTAYNQANAAYGAANAAYTHANAAYNFANTRFSASGGTISGDVAITGNLIVSGNSTIIDAEHLVVQDPFFILANNNTSDVLDIGFAAHYANATSDVVHTGLFRSASTKEWYLFKNYDEHFFYDGGTIDLSGNNFALDIINTGVRTSNLILGGVNAITWITDVYNAANNASAAAGFRTFDIQGVQLVADSNTDILQITSANGISLTANSSNDSFIIGLTETGVTPGLYGTADKVSVVTVDKWGRITAASNLSIAIDAAAITSGILGVPRGGTGVDTFTQNGILYGNTAGSLKVTAAGLEGQVLQASATGVPQFGMLDGGNF